MLNIPLKLDSEFLGEYKLLLINLAKETIEEVKSGYSQKEYMNKKEAAEYIGISFNTLKKFEREGLKIINVDGVQLIKRNDIDEFLDARKK